MVKLRKGMYVKSMSGISPVGFGNRVGRIIRVTTGHKPFKYRDVAVKMLDGNKSIMVFEDDTLTAISKREAMRLIK